MQVKFRQLLHYLLPTMTLQEYLARRRLFETLLVTFVLLAILLVNVTTLGIEQFRNGIGPFWKEAWINEATSVVSAGLLIPFIFYTLGKIREGANGMMQYLLCLLPVFIVASLLHIALFVVARKFFWGLSGETYVFPPTLLNFVYEIRKDLLSFTGLVVAHYGYQFIINRLQGEAQFLGHEDHAAPNQYPGQFLVKMLDREFLVQMDEIDWVQSASNYVVLNCGKRHFPMRQTMKQMASQLDPNTFQRVHRTAIVNLGRVSGISEKGGAEVLLRSGASVPVSQTWLPQLREILKSRGL